MSRGPREISSYSTRSIRRYTIDLAETAVRRRIFTWPKALIALPFLVVLALAIRTMVVGSTAWEYVLFSRYYVQLFVFFVLGIPTFRALWREFDEYRFFGIVLLGLIVGISAGVLSPGHETSFCYAAKGMLYRSRVVIPEVFRCTTVFWGIPAALMFWWVVLMRRRSASQA